MNLEMEGVSLPEQAEVKIEVSITSKINITAIVAQRKVSKLVLDQVGNLLYGRQPTLIAGERLLWRVPVWFGLPTTGPLGQVGTLDVDVQSGGGRWLGTSESRIYPRTTRVPVSLFSARPKFGGFVINAYASGLGLCSTKRIDASILGCMLPGAKWPAAI